MTSTPGFDIVYDRGTYVLDVDVNDGVHANDERRKFESDSGISFFVIRKEYWERALNQAQQDHERKESIQQNVHGENRNTFEICVKAKSPDGKHAKHVENPEHIPMIEFDYAFAADTPGGPKISMVVATNLIHGSIFAVVARRKGGQDDYVMKSFHNYIDRLGLVKAELNRSQALLMWQTR